MNEQEVRRLMADMESDRIERKSNVPNDIERITQAICAFANDLPNHRAPGYLLIGVSDRDGTPVGLNVTDDLLLNLSNIRDRGNILPQPAMTVERVSLNDGNNIIVIEVQPSDLPPVRYRGQVWIRVGPRRAIANEQEERILSERRVALAKTFDSRPCYGSTLDDIDLNIFLNQYLPNAIAPEILEANHRTRIEQLASLRFYDLAQNCLTNAGVILFGQDVLNWLPGAYIQFVRFDGSDLDSNVLNEKQLTGDLSTILREIETLIDINNRARPVATSTLREEMHYEYPSIALRELLLNAIMHRDYNVNSPIRFYWFNDRIEIQNPGGLYMPATPQNFPKQNSYRNPVIAEALKVLGYVNRFGAGVVRARRALEANAQVADFQFEDAYILANIHPTDNR